MKQYLATQNHIIKALVKFSFLSVTIFGLLIGCKPSVEVKEDKPMENIQAATLQPETKPEKLLRHVVMFKFKEGTSQEKIKEVEKAFAALPSKIEAIHGFEWGTDVSVEGISDGFTHCFLVTFASEEDRATYLPHPDHKAFVELIQPILEKPLVVDYWASN